MYDMLAWRYMTLGPAKNMKKEPVRADFECF